MLNEFNYHCPYCKKQLNKNQEVEFLITTESKRKGKIFLSPTPQTYGFRTEPEFNFKQKEEVEFICANCNENLRSKAYPKYVKIHLKITDKVLIDVFFSRVHGVRKTYVGLEDFKETYGDEMNL